MDGAVLAEVDMEVEDESFDKRAEFKGVKFNGGDYYNGWCHFRSVDDTSASDCGSHADCYMHFCCD